MTAVSWYCTVGLRWCGANHIRLCIWCKQGDKTKGSGSNFIRRWRYTTLHRIVNLNGYSSCCWVALWYCFSSREMFHCRNPNFQPLSHDVDCRDASSKASGQPVAQLDINMPAGYRIMAMSLEDRVWNSRSFSFASESLILQFFSTDEVSSFPVK